MYGFGLAPIKAEGEEFEFDHGGTEMLVMQTDVAGAKPHFKWVKPENAAAHMRAGWQSDQPYDYWLHVERWLKVHTTRVPRESGPRRLLRRLLCRA